MRRLIALLAALAVLALAGCSKPPLTERESYVFGTRVHISIWGLEPEVANRHIDAVLADFDRQHQRLHAWQPSAVTQLNQAFAKGETASIDLELAGLIRQGIQFEADSDGYFNPAIGQIVALWGFHGDTPRTTLPDAHAINQLRIARPRMADLVLTDTTIRSKNPSVALDFGGMAKGWALDRAAHYLREQRVRSALINIGGNVLALGRKDGKPWTVGLQNPRGPGVLGTIALTDGEAIGTSGDYQRFFELNGRRYSHLIEPELAEPTQNGTQAAIIIAPASEQAGLLSDVASKPLFLGPVARAGVYLERFGIQDALLIRNEGSYITNSLQNRLQWRDKPAHLYWLR